MAIRCRSRARLLCTKTTWCRVWQAATAGRFSEIATTRSSGWPLRDVPNGIPRPLGVFRYLSVETSQTRPLGNLARPQARRGSKYSYCAVRDLGELLQSAFCDRNDNASKTALPVAIPEPIANRA